MTANARRLDPSVFRLHSSITGARPNDHFVEIYDDDSAVVESVRTFMSIGISGGEVGVVIAGAPHRAAFEAALGRSVDLASAAARGLYVALDAEDTLAQFMKDGLPDAARFDDTIGAVVERALSMGNGVRLFGEMVALLWSRGEVEAALRLEELWNRLSERYPFRLFCAYPQSLFGDDELEPLRDVCGHHSHVIMPTAAVV